METMHIYQKIYEFAASAGAFEGYVYRKKQPDIDVAALSNWAGNLLILYYHFSAAAVEKFQFSCNQTLGRAIKSLVPVLGEKHEVPGKLKKMVKGDLPETADDFQKQKWFMKHRPTRLS
jgi:hypothetical protein